MRADDFAGCDALRVSQIAGSIAQCLSALHRAGWAHGDLKPKNIVTLGAAHERGRADAGRWKLIDLDASTRLGSALDDAFARKCSTGYTPPEVTQWLFADALTPLMTEVRGCQKSVKSGEPPLAFEALCSTQSSGFSPRVSVLSFEHVR